MPPIEVNVRRTTYTIGLVLSGVAFLVCGFWVLPRLGLFPPVVVGTVLTFIGIVTFAWQLATGPYLFRIDSVGIHDRSGTFQAGRVRWDEMVDVRVVIAEGRPQVGIALTDEGRARRSIFMGALMEEQRKLLGVDVVIPPEAMGPGKTDEYVALLQKIRGSGEERARLA